MDEKKDEFQELIRSFSLDQPPGQPSRPPQPGRTSSRAQASDDFLRQFSGPSPAQPGGQPRAKATGSPAGRFSPAAFDAGGAAQPRPAAPQRPPARPAAPQQPPARPAAPQQPPTRPAVPQQSPARPGAAAGVPPRAGAAVRPPVSGGQGRPASGRPALEHPAPVRPAPGRPAPAARPSPAQGRGFSASGFEAQAGPRTAAPPVMSEPVLPQKSFQLRIDNEEYRSIPDNARSSGGRGAAPPRPPASHSGAGGAAPPSGPPPKRKRRRRQGGVARFFEALLMALGAVACAFFLSIFALQSLSDMLGMNKEEHSAEVTIPENPTLDVVAEKLEEAGIITQPFTFKLYAMLTGDEDDVYRGGRLDLNSKMAYSQLLEKVKAGAKATREETRITFPEGKTIVQIAQMLEEKGVCSVEDFLEAADSGNYGYKFEDQIPDTPLRFHRMEGYIFPDTYNFYVPEDPSSVVNKFLSTFNQRVTQDLYQLMDAQGLTLDQTVTLASLILKEAGSIDYMYEVSSVFRNRLALAEGDPLRRLQSDATTDYIEKQIKPNLPSANQAMYDAYDTWICEGLPIGPINNPGLDAIKAALDPSETNYYFFLSDQKGEYHFSATYAEHLKFLADAGDAHGTSIEHSEASSAAESAAE